ncbi:MAG: hypothetical protein E6I75_03430 [Chloroflexi bacterium]|nr:MAG: hypothetical protein E6I75_03430 [Chloroflexota bacterium]
MSDAPPQDRIDRLERELRRAFEEAQREADAMFAQYQLSQLLAWGGPPADLANRVVAELVRLCGAASVLEHVVYAPDGQLITGSLLDYAVPRADGIPELEFDRTETPTPRNPLGAKGVGESATIGTPAAIANTVVDALRPLGVQDVELPITPQQVWRLLRSRQG